MQRIEKELQQKELRQEMKLRLARLQHHPVHKPQIVIIGGGGGGAGAVGGFSGRAGEHHHQVVMGGVHASGSAYVVGDPLMHHTVKCVTVPSPLTPNSTDELLPSVDEAQEVSFFAFQNYRSYKYTCNRFIRP